MNFFDTLYHNSSIFALTIAHDVPIVKLTIMYIFFYITLLFAIIGIYIILSSKRFFPPIYFNTDDILSSDNYGLSGLIKLLAGCFFLFPLYCWYFFFILLLILLMWWIYKKLMLK